MSYGPNRACPLCNLRYMDCPAHQHPEKRTMVARCVHCPECEVQWHIQAPLGPQGQPTSLLGLLGLPENVCWVCGKPGVAGPLP